MTAVQESEGEGGGYDDDVDNNRLTSGSDDGTFDDYETSEDELSVSDEIESTMRRAKTS